MKCSTFFQCPTLVLAVSKLEWFPQSVDTISTDIIGNSQHLAKGLLSSAGSIHAYWIELNWCYWEFEMLVSLKVWTFWVWSLVQQKDDCPFGSTVNIKAIEDCCRCVPLFSTVYIYFITKIHCFFLWDLAQANKQIFVLQKQSLLDARTVRHYWGRWEPN